MKNATSAVRCKTSYCSPFRMPGGTCKASCSPILYVRSSSWQAPGSVLICRQSRERVLGKRVAMPRALPCHCSVVAWSL